MSLMTSVEEVRDESESAGELVRRSVACPLGPLARAGLPRSGLGKHATTPLDMAIPVSARMKDEWYLLAYEYMRPTSLGEVHSTKPAT